MIWAIGIGVLLVVYMYWDMRRLEKEEQRLKRELEIYRAQKAAENLREMSLDDLVDRSNDRWGSKSGRSD